MKNKFNITVAFQEIFFTVVCFTLLSGGASFWFAAKDNLSPQQNRVFETCTWNIGIGAIFVGLLGSKATDLFQPNDEEEE